MKSVLSFLASLVLTSCVSTPNDNGAVELFSVQADLNPGNRRLTLRITEVKDRLAVEESAPSKHSRANVRGADAEALRARVNALRITQDDIDSLAGRRLVSRGPNGKDLLILEPFDGAYYRFTIRSAAGVRSIYVWNPESDPYFQGPFEAAERLRELMAFLRDASLIARGEQRANKAPEPTTMAVTSRAPSSTSRASHGRGSS